MGETMYIEWSLTNSRWELKNSKTVDEIGNNTVLRFKWTSSFQSIGTIYDSEWDSVSIMPFHSAMGVWQYEDLLGIVKETMYEGHPIFTFYDWYGGDYSVE